MRTLISAAVVVALMAVTANAIIITDPGAGALQMKLTYYPDGTAELVNISGAEIDIDSYEIWSATNKLDPTNGTGWKSIDDYSTDPFDADEMFVINNLGSDALGFGELGVPTTTFLSEGHLSADATFQIGFAFPIGKPIQNTVPPKSDLTFYYTKPTVVGDKFLGVVEYIPEPATMALLAMGACLPLLRRKQVSRGWP